MRQGMPGREREELGGGFEEGYRPWGCPAAVVSHEDGLFRRRRGRGARGGELWRWRRGRLGVAQERPEGG
jgi:hypothetical protein